MVGAQLSTAGLWPSWQYCSPAALSSERTCSTKAVDADNPPANWNAPRSVRRLRHLLAETPVRMSWPD